LYKISVYLEAGSLAVGC